MPNILICMKAVPTTAQVQTDGEFRLKRDGTDLQWNVADESALEVALQMKGPSGSVTVLTMGPKKLSAPLKELLMRGADRAVLLTDPLLAGADTIATAKALSKAVAALGEFDLILCGRRAMDGETGQVPAMLAAALGIPCVSNVESIGQEAGQWLLRRRLESETVELQYACPLVASVCEYSYVLRLPGVMSMRRARDKQVEEITAQQIGLAPQECGLKGSFTKVIKMDTKFPGLRKGPKETDIQKGAAQLITLLREVEK